MFNTKSMFLFNKQAGWKWFPLDSLIKPNKVRELKSHSGRRFRDPIHRDDAIMFSWARLDIPVPYAGRAQKGNVFKHWNINKIKHTFNTVLAQNAKPIWWFALASNWQLHLDLKGSTDAISLRQFDQSKALEPQKLKQPGRIPYCAIWSMRFTKKPFCFAVPSGMTLSLGMRFVVRPNLGTNLEKMKNLGMHLLFALH